MKLPKNHEKIENSDIIKLQANKDNNKQLSYFQNNVKTYNTNAKKIIEKKENFTSDIKTDYVLNKIKNIMEENEELSSDDSTFSDGTQSSASCSSTASNTSQTSQTIKTRNNNLPFLPKVDKSKSDLKKILQKDTAKSGSLTGNDIDTLQRNQKPSKKGKKNRLSICVAQTRYKIVGKVAKSVGWRLVRFSGHWNILWVDTDPGIEVYKDMKRYQKVNHFPGMQEICRKDLLARNLGRLLKIYPDEYDFYPKTWCFPADYMEAINFNREHRNKTFILKPDAGAQGRGIFLTKNIKESVKPTERLICQIYISRPLLIDGYKFDLRVYTLITTVDPLRIFVYNEGLVRMATTKYKDPNEFNVSDLFMHLTNYSVNKHSDNFSHDAQLGSKRKFSSLHRNLAKEGYDIDTLWRNIDDTIIKTILSSWPMLKHNYRACFPCHDVMQACFEILGFDILVDRNLKPYILEVNQSPSFYTDESVDYEVKEALIRDTLNLLNISLIDKTKIINEDKKRIKMRLLMTRKRTKLKSSYSKDHLGNPSIISPLGQQIAWEETHLGGFRRIMPAQTDTHKYSHLIQSQNQASIYSETAASKRREEAAKQMRITILEKQKQNQAMLLANKSLKRRIGGPSFKKSKEYNPIKKQWSNGVIISELEERERRRLLSDRDEILKQNDVLKVILETFHKMRILSDSDRVKYGDEIRGLNQKSNQGQPRLDLQNVACYTATVNDFTVRSILKSKLSSNTAESTEKFSTLPLVTLKLQENYKNQLSSILKISENKASIPQKVKQSIYTGMYLKTTTPKGLPNENPVINPYAKKKCAELLNNFIQIPIWKCYGKSQRYT